MGKKKTQDVQFYTEVMEVNQAIDAGRRSMYDPDELEEEQRERETRNRVRPHTLHARAWTALTQIRRLCHADLQACQKYRRGLAKMLRLSAAAAPLLKQHNRFVTSSQCTVSFLLYTSNIVLWPVALAAGQLARCHHGFHHLRYVAIQAR